MPPETQEPLLRYATRDANGLIKTQIVTIHEVEGGAWDFEQWKDEGLVIISRDRFSGMFDHNSKPLYERDVVRVKVIDWFGVSRFKAMVEFKDGVFGYDNRYPEGHRLKDFIPLRSVDGVWKLGNIHKNPELLEEDFDE